MVFVILCVVLIIIANDRHSTRAHTHIHIYTLTSHTHNTHTRTHTHTHTHTHKAALGNAVVVSSGHTATHILPIVQGRVDAANSKRIELGGVDLSGFMLRLLELKAPALRPHLSVFRARVS